MSRPRFDDLSLVGIPNIVVFGFASIAILQTSGGFPGLIAFEKPVASLTKVI
jgi:hypothetical protein